MQPLSVRPRQTSNAVTIDDLIFNLSLAVE
jgi:hypothetical protein